MPVTFGFEWLVEDMVCKVVLPEDFNDAALKEYDDMLVEVLDRMPHKIHLVADLRGVKNTASLNQAEAPSSSEYGARPHDWLASQSHCPFSGITGRTGSRGFI
jgi:hypothetical protein